MSGSATSRPASSSALSVAQPSSFRREAFNLLPALVLLAAILELAALRGASHRDLLVASLVVLAVQAVPGVIVWRLVRPRDGWHVEDLVMGVAVGAAVAVPSQVLSVALSWSPLSWLTPLVIAGTLLLVPATRRRVREARCAGLPRAWGVAVAAACVIPVLMAGRFFLQEPLRWSGWGVQYVDLPYHLALVGEVSHHFPPQYPQVAGEPLHYHWFAHAWIAQVAGDSGASPDTVLIRFMPALIAVLVPLGTAVVALRVSRLPWAAPVAAAVAFSFVDLDVWGLVRASLPVNPQSPSQGFGMLLLLPTVALLVSRWRGEARAGGTLVMVALMALAGGSKGSVLPVLVCGLALAALAALVTKSSVRRLIGLDLVVVSGLLAIVVKTVFGGSDGGVTWAPLKALSRIPGQSFTGAASPATGAALVVVVILALVVMYLGAAAAAVPLTDRTIRRDPAAWLLAGCAAAGAGAVLFTSRSGQGQYYFLWAAEVPLGVLVGWGIGLFLRRSAHRLAVTALGVVTGLGAVVLTQQLWGPLDERTERLGAAVAALATFIAAVALVAATSVFMLGTCRVRRWRSGVAVALVATAVAGLVPALYGSFDALPDEPRATATSKNAFHSGQIAAARWIRGHSDPDDLVMTNRHCQGPEKPGCDRARFFVTAYSERRVLVEGWAYTERANTLNLGTPEYDPGSGPFSDPELLALNDGFISDPSMEAGRALYDLGVRWVFVDATAPHAGTLEPYARLRFKTATARIYELHAP